MPEDKSFKCRLTEYASDLDIVYKRCLGSKSKEEVIAAYEQAQNNLRNILILGKDIGFNQILSTFKFIEK